MIAITHLGYIKRMTSDTFKSQNRGGKGIRGMPTLEDDYIEDIFMTSTHHIIMFFTNQGRVYQMKGYRIPEAGRNARGTAIINLLQLQPDEKVTAGIAIDEFREGHYLLMATKKGIIKKTPIMAYANARKNGLAAITLQEDDELIDVKFTDGNRDTMLITENGLLIRFNEKDVRDTGRTSMGVRGIRLDKGDRVVSMQLDVQGEFILFASENGYGKRTRISEFNVQNRGGRGKICYKENDKTGKLIGARSVEEDNEAMLITTEGIIIRFYVSDVSVLGRYAAGVKLMNVGDDVTVAGLSKVRNDEDDLPKDEDGNPIYPEGTVSDNSGEAETEKENEEDSSDSQDL